MRAFAAALTLLGTLVLGALPPFAAQAAPGPLAPGEAAQAAPGLAAVQAAPEGWAYDLWNELMSPFCPGRTLADCPSSQADQLRMWVLAQEAAGRSREDVRSELLERYGDAIRSTPAARGFGLAAYVVPALLLLLGAGLLVLYLRRQTRQGVPQAAPPAADHDLDPELERRIDEELAR